MKIAQSKFASFFNSTVSLLTTSGLYDWTVQGLGMLRCYPVDESSTWRLNVWHSRFRVSPPASSLHDHPWHLVSYVLAGRVMNKRYIVVDADMPGEDYQIKRILCGPENAGKNIDSLPDSKLIRLGPCTPEVYGAGHMYTQVATEIHETEFTDGSVTLNYRERVNGDIAHIFFPRDEAWIDAAPRKATEEEIRFGCSIALEEMAKVTL